MCAVYFLANCIQYGPYCIHYINLKKRKKNGLIEKGVMQFLNAYLLCIYTTDEKNKLKMSSPLQIINFKH
jgi:ubiquitin C-terminal hydrolase